MATHWIPSNKRVKNQGAAPHPRLWTARYPDCMGKAHQLHKAPVAELRFQSTSLVTVMVDQGQVITSTAEERSWCIGQPHESCVNIWLLLDLSNIMKNRKRNKDHAGTATALQCQLYSYQTQTRKIKSCEDTRKYKAREILERQGIPAQHHCLHCFKMNEFKVYWVIMSLIEEKKKPQKQFEMLNTTYW